MTAITYNLIKKLEQAGFTPPQVEVLASFTSTAASKPEIEHIEKEIKEDVKEVTHKIDKAETRLEKRMDERFSRVDERFSRVDERFNLIDQRFNVIDQRFDVLERQFASMRSLLKWLIGITIAIVPSITTWMTWFSHASLR